jgi:hypothetical protein
MVNQSATNNQQPLNHDGVPCGSGFTFIRLQALATGRYPLQSLTQVSLESEFSGFKDLQNDKHHVY